MTRTALPSEPWPEPGADSREKAMLAHDIRIALNGVTGGLAVLDRVRLDPESRVQIDRVAAAAEALTLLVGEALGDAPEAGPTETPDLAGIVRFLQRRWSGEAVEKGLSLRAEFGPGLPEGLRVPALDLARVLGNLLSNAVKFTPAGTVRLALRREADGALAFVLEDEGPGLGGCPPERACEYGFRHGGPEAGQGIGLHIVKALTDRMGGDLRLAGRPAGGLEAVLRLPAALCIEAREKAQAPDEAAPDLAGLRVLLAEDNPTNQMVASQMLASMAASVAVAADGIEALAFFERERFDLVVVDIEMPRMSGLEVIRAIRARPDRRARTPVIALTAYAMQEHRLRIAEAGADGLISKPIVSTVAFGRTVAQHVGAAPREVHPAGDDPVESEPIIDLATFRSLADTIGPDMMSELLDRIAADLESARAKLEAALDPVDAESIRTNSHILISVAGAFGASRLRRRAADLNAAAHAGAGGALADETRACLAEIGPAMDFAKAQRTAC